MPNYLKLVFPLLFISSFIFAQQDSKIDLKSSNNNTITITQVGDSQKSSVKLDSCNDNRIENKQNQAKGIGALSFIEWAKTNTATLIALVTAFILLFAALINNWDKIFKPTNKKKK